MSTPDDLTTAIALQGSLDMTVDGRRLGGAQQVALLERIATDGSITRAAKSVGISYKNAWDTVDAMNQLAGEPLVERVAGGKGGGGTRLTERGERLIHNFRQLEEAHARFVQLLEQQANGLVDDYQLVRRMTMQTSARNQYLGTVKQLTRGAVNDEVVLALPGGQEIVATVTHDSVLALGLVEGAQALALVKASAILLGVDMDGVKVSARNCMSGMISRLHPGAVNTEVVIDLGHGQSVAAIVTRDSAERLQLAEGQPASALFKASSVILAVPA